MAEEGTPSVNSDELENIANPLARGLRSIHFGGGGDSGDQEQAQGDGQDHDQECKQHGAEENQGQSQQQQQEQGQGEQKQDEEEKQDEPNPDPTANQQQINPQQQQQQNRSNQSANQESNQQVSNQQSLSPTTELSIHSSSQPQSNPSNNPPNPSNDQPNDSPNDPPNDPPSNPPSNPPIIDGTQSNSVYFFNHNNVDILNQLDHGLVLENENLYDQIDLAEKEYQKLQLQLQQKTLQMEQVLYAFGNQRKVVIGLIKEIQERDGEIDSLQQKLSVREITPLDREIINGLKDQVKNLQNSLSLRDEQYKKAKQETIDIEQLLEQEQNEHTKTLNKLFILQESIDKWNIKLPFDNNLPLSITNETVHEIHNAIVAMERDNKQQDLFIQNIRGIHLKDVNIDNTNVQYLLNKISQGHAFNSKVIKELKCIVESKMNISANSPKNDMNEIHETTEIPTSADFVTD